VAARDEQRLIGTTLQALAHALPRARLWVADDGSRDATATVARTAGAGVVSGPRLGKGAAMTRAATHALDVRGRGERPQGPAVFLLCDADLGRSAAALEALVEEITAGRADLAVAAFERRRGGGFGIARGFARWAIRRRCGLDTQAPVCGQRALTADALGTLLPFAPGWGMELAMTVDAVRAGLVVRELELPLEHRAVGRSPSGFVHRARQLRDFARAYRTRAVDARPTARQAAAPSE
jgi:glycosyltransferase involved in cell wall biosynthesis